MYSIMFLSIFLHPISVHQLKSLPTPDLICRHDPATSFFQTASAFRGAGSEQSRPQFLQQSNHNLNVSDLTGQQAIIMFCKWQSVSFPESIFRVYNQAGSVCTSVMKVWIQDIAGCISVPLQLLDNHFNKLNFRTKEKIVPQICAPTPLTPFC